MTERCLECSYHPALSGGLCRRCLEAFQDQLVPRVGVDDNQLVIRYRHVEVIAYL